MNNTAMKAGGYTATIKVTASDGIEEEWVEDFTISKRDASKYNERDLGLQDSDNFKKKIILFVGIVVIMSILVAFIINRINYFNRNKQK